MTGYFKKVIEFLSPSPPIAGVEISDFYIRFFYVKNDRMMNLDVRLMPGVVKDGRVIQRDKLKDAFSKLMQKLGKSAKKLPHIIITTPSSSIFLQTFNLPYLAPDKVPEAAELNLQMISPLPIEEAYTDWDELGEDKAGGQITFLGVFTDRKNIDAMVEACREVGFVVVAIEPSVFALERAVRAASPELDADDFHILLNVTNEGMDFVGISRKKVRFDYFVSWLSMYEGATEISTQLFEDTVARYTQQVLNFALSNIGVSPKEVVLVASEFHDEIRSIIEKKFNVKVTPLDAFANGKLTAVGGVSYGAYLRGLLPRGEDNLISLTSIGTKEEFEHSQIILFLKLWRNIGAAFGVTLLVIFAVSLFFLQSVLSRNQAIPAQDLPANEKNELQGLISSATDFNSLVQKVQNSLGKRVVIYPYLAAVQSSLTSDITLNQIGFQSLSSPLVISGTGASDTSIKKFKKMLEGVSLFKSVELPLTSLAPSGGGQLNFSMNITLAQQ